MYSSIYLVMLALAEFLLVSFRFSLVRLCVPVLSVRLEFGWNPIFHDVTRASYMLSYADDVTSASLTHMNMDERITRPRSEPHAVVANRVWLLINPIAYTVVKAAAAGIIRTERVASRIHRHYDGRQVAAARVEIASRKFPVTICSLRLEISYASVCEPIVAVRRNKSADASQAFLE